MKKATNKYGIDYIITVTNKDNERPVEQMVGKAMCAYANAKRASERPDGFFFKKLSEHEVEVEVAKMWSEYEATVRCIAMFVDQPTSCICGYVIARVEEEFGI
jgi:hypothetical protein